MPRLGSIGRLMVIVGLVAAAMAVYRAWSGQSNFLGVLGPMATCSLLAGAGAIPIQGRSRRFLIGFAAIGCVAAGSMLFLPHRWVQGVGKSIFPLVSPTASWLGSTTAEDLVLFRLELLLWEFDAPSGEDEYPVEYWFLARLIPRSPDFFSARLQGYFGLLQAIPALAGGLIFALIPNEDLRARPAPREAS